MHKNFEKHWDKFWKLLFSVPFCFAYSMGQNKDRILGRNENQNWFGKINERKIFTCQQEKAVRRKEKRNLKW